MQISQSLGKLPGPFEDLSVIKTSLARQRLVERFSLDKIDDRKNLPVYFKKVINLRQIGIAQVFQNIRLRAAVQHILRNVLDLLHHNVFFQIFMIRLIDNSPAAGSDLLHKRIHMIQAGPYL